MTAQLAPVPTDAPAEFEIVRYCAATHRGGGDGGPAIADVEAVKWPEVLGMAAFHGVMPLVYARLKQEGPIEVPASVLETCRRVVNARTAYSMFLIQEIGRLARLLEERSARALIFKGLPLAQNAYGSVALRTFVDIDLLVHPDEWDTLEGLLRESGYRAAMPGDARRRAYVFIHRQVTFRRSVRLGQSADVVAVDLHSAVLPPGYRFGVTFEELWERSEVFAVSGTSTRTPGPEDMLAILTLNGLKSRWDRLRHIVDVAETIRARPDLDWDALVARADRGRWRRALFVALTLAQRVAGAPVPRDLAELAAADPRAQSVADDVVRALPHQPPQNGVSLRERIRTNLAVQDDWRGGARYAAFTVLRRLADLVGGVTTHD